MNDNSFVRGNRHEIFVGIKDQDVYEELLTISDLKNIVLEVCVKQKLCFTLLKQFGGFTHNKGFTTETSFRVVIIGSTDEQIELLAQELKRRVNTDTVLITKTDIEYQFT